MGLTPRTPGQKFQASLERAGDQLGEPPPSCQWHYEANRDRELTKRTEAPDLRHGARVRNAGHFSNIPDYPLTPRHLRVHLELGGMLPAQAMAPPVPLFSCASDRTHRAIPPLILANRPIIVTRPARSLTPAPSICLAVLAETS